MQGSYRFVLLMWQPSVFVSIFSVMWIYTFQVQSDDNGSARRLQPFFEIIFFLQTSWIKLIVFFFFFFARFLMPSLTFFHSHSSHMVKPLLSATGYASPSSYLRALSYLLIVIPPINRELGACSTTLSMDPIT